VVLPDPGDGPPGPIAGSALAALARAYVLAAA
jgi:hypothetical protein